MVEVQSCKVNALLHHSALLYSGLGLFSIVGFPWFHHIPSFPDVTRGTRASSLLYSKNSLNEEYFLSAMLVSLLLKTPLINKPSHDVTTETQQC
jgi:hypothetical protein